MSPSSVRQLRGRRGRASNPDAGTDDVLCYMDQGSFLGLRALGRGPVLQLTWLYPHPIDEVALREFGEQLAQGILGRLVQRSPLPWGRHRWVTNPVPGPVTWFRDPLPEANLARSRYALLDLPVDPEHGPGWRLAVQPLTEGGCALTLLVSHTIADMRATSQAIVDAVAGRRLAPGFPASSRRWSPKMLVRDSLESMRALPDLCRALSALTRRSRQGGLGLSRQSPSVGDRRNDLEPVADVPLVEVVMNAETFRQYASLRGVESNALVLALAARLAFRMGRLDASGRVKLVLPVSDRHPGDRRGNALRSITIMVDPEACHEDLRALQRDLRTALTTLIRNGDDASPLFPLIPYVPLWLARYMERAALGADLPVGCSLVGELPSEVYRPCGQALQLQASILEHYAVPELERLGGLLFVACYRNDEKLFVTVSGYQPGHVTTRDALMPLVNMSLADLRLDGTAS